MSMGKPKEAFPPSIPLLPTESAISAGSTGSPLFLKGVHLPEDLLVVLDDMDTPLGVLRFREKGRSGGQKGLASIIEALGGDRISRIKVGIGRPIEGQDASDYVLGSLHPEERILLEKAQQSFFDLVDRWLFSGRKTEA